MTLIERAEPRCSFCRRSRLEVTKLVIDDAGRSGCCDECFVTLAKGFASTR